MSCSRAVPRDPNIARLSELLARAGRGDHRAFAELHASTRNKLRKTARSVSPTMDVDDLLQDTYLKIWNKAASFDPARASPITWMCAIMRNTAIDALRLKQLPTAEIEEALSVADPMDHGDDGFDCELVQPIAARVLDALPDDRRDLLSLAYLQGESRLMLSQRFGVPVGTIKTWLRRTLQSVRQDCLAAAALQAAR